MLKNESVGENSTVRRLLRQSATTVATCCRWTGVTINRVWRLRLPIAFTLTIPIGCAVAYYPGYLQLREKPPQEEFYNQAMALFHSQKPYLDDKAHWPSYNFESALGPAIPYLERSLAAYEEQSQANIWQRFLYGRPNVRLAAQAYLAEAHFFVLTANHKQEKFAAAKSMLEKAIVLNPGMPYAESLSLEPIAINQLNYLAILIQRNLELLYRDNANIRLPARKDGADKKGEKSQTDGKEQSDRQEQTKEPGNESASDAQDEHPDANAKGAGDTGGDKQGEGLSGNPNAKRETPFDGEVDDPNQDIQGQRGAHLKPSAKPNTQQNEGAGSIDGI